MSKRDFPTVDELLDSIDLSFTNYKPSKEALHFWNVMQLIKGAKFFSAGIPILHYYFIDLVFGNVKREQLPYSEEINKRVALKKNKLAILCSRGLSKSTTFSCFLVIYMAMFGRLPGLKRPGIGDKVNFVIGVGDSQEGGAKVMCNTLRDMIEESDLLQNYFEKVRCTDAEIELVRKGEDPVNERSFMFRVKGAQAGIRGQRYKGERIDVIIGDDLVKNEADSRSQTIMQSIRSTIYSDATHALRAQGGMEILIGTPFNKNDVVYSAVEGGWTPLVVPICKSIKEDLLEEEFQGAWPEMHTYERVVDRYLDMIEAGEGAAFQQELMLRISSEEEKLVKEDQVQWYSRETLKSNLGSYNIYATTDYTASNDLKGDYSCTMIWAVNARNDWFLLDLSVKKATIAEQYEPLFRFVREWGSRYGRHVTVGVEIDGQQQLNLHALKKMMLEYNVYFGFARQIGSPFGKEGISRRQATGAKHEQFMRVHPLFQQHKIYFPEELKGTVDMKEVLNELSYITYTGITSKHDDCGTFDTKVDTPYGYKLLGELVNGDEVIGFSKGGSAVVKVEDVRITGIKPIVNIETESGSILKFSEFHPVLTNNGYKTMRDLHIGDKIVRNTTWKTELNMETSLGLKSLQDITNQLSDVQTGLEKTGCTNLCTKLSMDQSHKATTFTTKMKIRVIIDQITWSYLVEKNTKKNIMNKMLKMGMYYPSMLRKTLKKFKHSQNWEKKESTLVGLKGKSCLTNQYSVHTVEKSLFHIRRLEKTLNSVVQAAQENGINVSEFQIENARTVEQYSLQLLKHLQHVKSADLRIELEALTKSLTKYAKYADVYSKAIQGINTVETNAKELKKIDYAGKLEVIKRIWVSAPETTYNFDVDSTHNYQVHDGYVVHNCLDCISMLASMEVIAPSEEVDTPTYREESKDYIWHRYGGKDDEDSGSSVVF